jgi:hypothetical protein
MELTDEQIQEIKAKYGKFTVVEVEGGFTACLHYKLDRNTLSKALSVASNDPVLANELIFSAVAIKEYTSPELFTEPMLLMSMAEHLGRVMELKKTTATTY